MESAEFDEMYALATRRGKALEELEKKNARRRAKGLPPLLSDSEKADRAVQRRKYKTNDPTTVTSEEALKLYMMRKEQIRGSSPTEDDEEEVAMPRKQVRKVAEAKQDDAKPDAAVERAIREAAAVRHVEDLKNGRINHSGVWSQQGNALEGGDPTKLPEQPSSPTEKGSGQEGVVVSTKRRGPSGKGVSAGELDAFRDDLYGRLKVSFEELEKSVSDLQGRVAEIVTASVQTTDAADNVSPDSALANMLNGRTPITFDVHGTKMTCDAVKVFYNSPCITIMSRIDSATIQPEAGARLRLSYEANGRKYVDDPVTFVGLKVDLPELGFSLVGFVRDQETDLVDVPPEA